MSAELKDLLRKPEKREIKIDEVLRRGVETIYPSLEGLRSEMLKRRMRLYLGIDPTSPDLHIGHTVPLRKLRQFQDLGHEVILLFGTFTGKIGDPTDKSATRVRLTDEEIRHNLQTYVDQASRILDLSKTAKNPISIRSNDEWLAPLTFEQVTDLAANFSVQQMLARSSFKTRLSDRKPISLHEFLYPLMQGYDSVAMDVDLEVGGKDQIPNMLDGRTLVQAYKEHEKWVLGTKLIEDPSGKKMGKTEGNIVNLKDLPEIKYEGIMTWPDTAIPLGFELITSVQLDQVHLVADLLRSGQIDPMQAKEALAFRVVAELDGIDDARFAEEEFDRVKRKGELPRNIRAIQLEKEISLSLALVKLGLVRSEAEALRRIQEGAVFIDGKSAGRNSKLITDSVVQLGKKTIKGVVKALLK